MKRGLVLGALVVVGALSTIVGTVQAAKKAGQTIDDVVNSWKLPERFLKNGYMTPEENQRLARQPMAVRLRTNVEVAWNETK